VNSVADIYNGVCCVLCIHSSVVIGAFMKWKYLQWKIVTLASAGIMVIFIFIYGIVYHHCQSLLTAQ
jgi:hypothetical protein